MSEHGNEIDGKAEAAAKKPRVKKTAAPADTTSTTSDTNSGVTDAPTANAGSGADTSGVASAENGTGTALTVTDTPSSETGSLGAAAAKVSAMIPDNMTEKAREVASDVKEKASDAVQGLARIISDSAGAIDDNVGPKYGDYARTAAQSVSDAAERLRAKPVDEIAEQTREFVRTKPAAAMGIAAVAGLLLTKIFGSVFGKKR